MNIMTSQKLLIEQLVKACPNKTHTLSVQTEGVVPTRLLELCLLHRMHAVSNLSWICVKNHLTMRMGWDVAMH